MLDGDEQSLRSTKYIIFDQPPGFPSLQHVETSKVFDYSWCNVEKANKYLLIFFYTNPDVDLTLRIL